MQIVKRTSLLLGFTTLVTTLVTTALISSAAHAGWERTWIEKFDGTGVDISHWTAQTQANYNNEIQCYTDDETSADRNYEVSNGTLKITARKQNIACPGLNGQNKSWTSGRLNSKDKAEFLYGRIETRLKFDELRNGTWPAFWMLEGRIREQPIANDNDIVGWPNPGAGEIDVWEWHGNAGNSFITAFHNVNRSQCGGTVRYNYPGGAPDVQSFNTYAIEWSADEISLYANDNLVVRHDMTNCAQYEEPMFLLLNVAIGGTLGGNVDPTMTQATMEVDYVARCVANEASTVNACNEFTPVAVDSDMDGVADIEDQCPNSQVNTTVDITGCEVTQTTPVSATPETAPLAPTHNADDVISLFSDAYNNIDSIDYNPNWNQATQVTQVQVEGNTVLKYTGLNYQGTDYGDNKQDVSGYEFLHIDYWTANAQSLELYLISPGPQETPHVINVVKGSWQRLAIPLSTFASVVDLSNTFQLKIAGSGDVYLDNIYFSKAPENVVVTPVNVTPIIVSLSATQNNIAISQIDPAAGIVTITATVTDSDGLSDHVYTWSSVAVSNQTVSNNGLIVTFDPSSISGSSVDMALEITDNGTPVMTVVDNVVLNVVTTNTNTPINNPEVTTPSSSGGSLAGWLLILLGGSSLLRYARRLNSY
jgi:beta-glucanase (GH16 family)